MVHLKDYGVFVSITVFSSALASCLWSVKCPCGTSNTTFSFCLDVPLPDSDTCARWTNCATCRNNLNKCLSCPFGRSGASCNQVISFGNEDSILGFLQKRQNPNEPVSSNTINYKRVRKRSSAVLLTCPDPGQVDNANKKKLYTEKQDFFPGEKVGYVCHPGYALVGKPVLRCLNDSQWSAEVPECHYLYTVANGTKSDTLCSHPGEVENADIIWRPQAAMFSCHDGYVRVGTSVLRCVAPGQWDGELPRCIRPHRRQGSVATSYDADTLSLSECLDPGEVDSADRYTDGLPENTYFHTISYKCAPGYTAVGASVLKCFGNDRWSSDKPKCVKVHWNPQASGTSDEGDYDEDEESDDDRVTNCTSPGPIDNGHWTILSYFKGYGVTPNADDDEFPERTRLKYFCDSGYSLVGRFPTMHCQRTGFWSSETPYCHLDCGYSALHSLKKVHRGVTTEPGEWPWTVAISKISGGFSRLICGGSLLDNRTVLTAAHCLMNPHLEDIDDIRLYFGKYNRSNERDDDEVVMRKPSVFMIHPEYDAESKDNDIALIRVRQPVEYTSRIKPVCLPTAKTSEQNLQPDSSGYVVGWGTTEMNLESEELLMAITPVVPAPDCRSALKRQNINMSITSNMFCAGFAQGGVGSCKGDSGGPLVFHDPGTDRHTVEGIVSFGRHRECDMPGRYTVYTQVSRYLDWIKESMAAMSDAPKLPPPQIACAPPKCAPNCRIQTVYDGPCPGCECKRNEEIDLGKIDCDPPKCEPGCVLEKTFDGSCPGCECPDQKKEVERTRTQPGICDPPKCDRGCVMETRFTTECPGCDCKNQAETLKLMANRVICDPPKCRPGCSIQTIYSGRCPGCDCKRQEELPRIRPNKVICDPPKCPAGCSLQTVYNGPCPGCDCKDREELPRIRPNKVICDPPKCPAGCRLQTVYNGPCPGCDCKEVPKVSVPKIMCDPPTCPPGCPVRTVEPGPCPVCDCKINEEVPKVSVPEIMCAPPRCTPGCPVRTVEPGPCPVCDCKFNEENFKPLPVKVACDPPKCPPSCRIQTVYTGPCPGCDCETAEEDQKETPQCAPPQCQPPCTVQTRFDGPCPGCDCKKVETAEAKPSYNLTVGDEYVLRYNTAVMMCHVDGKVKDDVNVISWIRDDVTTIVSNAKEGGRYSVFDSGELHIRNVNVSDVASYRCKAIHRITQEVVVSDSYGKLFVVETNFPTPPILLDRRTSISAVQGDLVEIPAAAQGFPVPRYNWYKYGGSDTTELLHLRLDSRMTQLSGSLLIRQVRFEDAGKYSCSMSNGHGLTKIEIFLTVTENQKCAPLRECSAPQCTVETTGQGCEVCKCQSRSAPLASAPKPKCPRSCFKRCSFKGRDENGCAICDCNKPPSGK